MPDPTAHRHPAHDCVSVAIASSIAGVSKTSVRHWLAQGYIRAVPNRRPVRIPLSEIERLLGTPTSDFAVIAAASDEAQDRRGNLGRVLPTPRGKPSVYAPLSHVFSDGHLDDHFDAINRLVSLEVDKDEPTPTRHQHQEPTP